MADPLAAAARKVEAALVAGGVTLTLGGEPTYVPAAPDGSEWSVTALGPTKLRYGYALADALIAQEFPRAVSFYTPGKSYPGETNPRWAIQLLWNRNGSPLVPSLRKPLRFKRPRPKCVGVFRASLLRRLGLLRGWLRADDPFDKERCAWVLPLDHDERGFRSEDWTLGKRIALLRTDGPAGLRLPLQDVPPDVSRRALTVEWHDGAFHVFLPPFIQPGFLALCEHVCAALHEAKLGPLRFAGYLPGDDTDRWTRLAIAADPGVLEINLPPCATWNEYRCWLRLIERAAATAGLRSYKELTPGDSIGTGGGNHLLFGGPSLDDHPLFTRPRWVVSLLRYWQHHPSLAYLFTGQYVGSSSQAPRPDESANALYDLEMAYQFLEQLPPGDHRYLISETLRHLHTDGGGNTHRSEASFDKFWNVSFDGGCRGLIEFRALESLPRADWMAAVALLWRALAAHLLAHPCTAPLIDHGAQLHDRYFLPACLWTDFTQILADLRAGGFALPEKIFRAIFAWRFPTMLDATFDGARLAIRLALEGWPLLCETPLEGGTTSRFVDTSIERLEFTASPAFAAKYRIFVQGRELPLVPLGDRWIGAGLRYRRTALYPSLHPGVPVQLPLYVVVEGARKRRVFRLEFGRRHFRPCPVKLAPALGAPCKKLQIDLLTFDLRLP